MLLGGPGDRAWTLPGRRSFGSIHWYLRGAGAEGQRQGLVLGQGSAEGRFQHQRSDCSRATEMRKIAFSQ